MIGENRVRGFCTVHLDGMALQSTTTITTAVGKKNRLYLLSYSEIFTSLLMKCHW